MSDCGLDGVAVKDSLVISQTAESPVGSPQPSTRTSQRLQAKALANPKPPTKPPAVARRRRVAQPECSQVIEGTFSTIYNNKTAQRMGTVDNEPQVQAPAPSSASGTLPVEQDDSKRKDAGIVPQLAPSTAPADPGLLPTVCSTSPPVQNDSRDEDIPMLEQPASPIIPADSGPSSIAPPSTSPVDHQVIDSDMSTELAPSGFTREDAGISAAPADSGSSPIALPTGPAAPNDVEHENVAKLGQPAISPVVVDSCPGSPPIDLAMLADLMSHDGHQGVDPAMSAQFGSSYFGASPPPTAHNQLDLDGKRVSAVMQWMGYRDIAAAAALPDGSAIRSTPSQYSGQPSPCIDPFSVQSLLRILHRIEAKASEMNQDPPEEILASCLEKNPPCLDPPRDDARAIELHQLWSFLDRYGVPEYYGWVRQLGAHDLKSLLFICRAGPSAWASGKDPRGRMLPPALAMGFLQVLRPIVEAEARRLGMHVLLF